MGQQRQRRDANAPERGGEQTRISLFSSTPMDPLAERAGRGETMCSRLSSRILRIGRQRGSFWRACASRRGRFWHPLYSFRLSTFFFRCFAWSLLTSFGAPSVRLSLSLSSPACLHPPGCCFPWGVLCLLHLFGCLLPTRSSPFACEVVRAPPKSFLPLVRSSFGLAAVTPACPLPFTLSPLQFNPRPCLF
jgi:hypothetical protein